MFIHLALCRASPELRGHPWSPEVVACGCEYPYGLGSTRQRNSSHRCVR
jgi:hypothetical protein